MYLFKSCDISCNVFQRDGIFYGQLVALTLYTSSVHQNSGVRRQT